MQLPNRDYSHDPLRQFREGWRTKARNARDTWLPGTLPIETALESTFREGVRFAAELLEREGHRELCDQDPGAHRAEGLRMPRQLGNRDDAVKRPNVFCVMESEGV